MVIIFAYDRITISFSANWMNHASLSDDWINAFDSVVGNDICFTCIVLLAVSQMHSAESVVLFIGDKECWPNYYLKTEVSPYGMVLDLLLFVVSVTIDGFW
jgi:hypothetical protein